jgi:predicted DNA-binding ribbon-helix-helix protein
MDKQRFSIRIESERMEKLRRVAKQRKKTMTQLVEDWIDRLEEKPPSATLKGGA